MRRLLGMAIALVLANCGTGTVYAPGPPTTLDDATVQHIQIFANGDWRDTGVQLRRNQTYRITAEGQWSSGLVCGWTDASGAGVSPLCAGDTWGLGVSPSSLIGRIGPSGRPFAVGTALTLTPAEDGNLWLRDYDLIEFDNTGALNVSIARAGPPAATPIATAPTPAPTPAPAPVPAARAVAVAQPPRPVAQPLSIRYPRGPERPDDVAVVIGNADYRRLGKDIPDVPPARADAASVRRYVTEALGVKDGNVIALDDATSAQMTRVFGSRDDPRGQLFDWVKPGRSRVFVYYAGHGAPGRDGGGPMLVPVDADAARIELNGYPLKQLYDNLGRLPADSVTVVIEACFSGLSPAGSVLGKASPVFFEVKAPPVPARLTVITAGAANQVASWEPDESHGLFTRAFLEGMSGKADFDHDGRVTLDELDRHLKDTLTYLARRHYGRDQTAQIVKGGAP
jgi:hypothetical protein